MDYKIIGLSPEPFLALYGLTDAALAERNVKRFRADSRPGYPERVEIRDAEVGETVLLVNFLHQPGQTPYRASHAVFVREGAERAATYLNEIPESLKLRPLSVRAFDAGHWMVDADLCDGRHLDGVLQRLLGNEKVDYLQVHFAKQGCYAARVERLSPAPRPGSVAVGSARGCARVLTELDGYDVCDCSIQCNVKPSL